MRTVVAGTGAEFFSQPFSDTLRALPGFGAADDEGEPWGAEWVSVRIGRGEARVRGAPFRIEQYSLAEIAPIPVGPDRLGSHRFGQRRRQIELPRPAVALMRNGDGTRVYALTRALQDSFNPAAPTALALHSLDPIQMGEASAPILLPDWVGTFGDAFLPMMALHPDGRTVATTAGMQPKFNVADLASGTARAIAVDDADAVMDVAFSHGTHNHGMLAINVAKVMDAADRRLMPGALVKSQVRVGSFTGGEFVVHGTSRWSYGASRVPAALDWATDGAGIVAALDHPYFSPVGFAMDPLAAYMTVSDGGSRIETTRELHPCREPAFVMDVLTTNGHLPTATPTPTDAPSPTATATPTPTPTASATPSPSATAIATPTPTPTPTAPPHPIYLPVSLNEQCLPHQIRQDVVLVLDTSSSMSAATRAGRRKIDAAREAALGYLALLKLEDGDRAAVVTFDVTARVVERLSSHRPTLGAALRDASLGIQTCIPCAMEAAATELAPPRRRDGNTPVIVLLTDGRSNPRPVAEAVDLAARAKGTGIVVYTIGLGDDIESDALAAMASRPSFFFRAPDAEDLAALYASIAVDVPCPAARFWGRR
ncbi:MAG: VWA domain-containing protein [Chloroflexi bacterium CFX6]|nr:VWA domain-containing protein [Chloroflexi bacterium CFX6]